MHFMQIRVWDDEILCISMVFWLTTTSSSLMKSNKIVSIQRQYIVVAILLGAIVITLSVFAYVNELGRTNTLVRQADGISRQLRVISNVANHLSNTQHHIDRFMLEPDRYGDIGMLTLDLRQARSHVLTLQSDPIIASIPSHVLLDSILLKTDRFEEKIHELARIRIDANSQYPSLGIAATIMRPNRNNVFTIFNTIINEFIENEELRGHAEMFNALVQAQKIWITTISEFRLYIANRLGSFAEQGLLEQERTIENYLQNLESIIQRIPQADAESNLGFLGAELIKELPGYIAAWKAGFHQVRMIHHSSEWRQDSKILSENIIPLISDIRSALDELDVDLQSLNNSNLDELNKSGSNLSVVLAGVILLFLLYIILSILSLKSLVIRPISLISEALKDEAFGRTSLHKLRIRKTRETQDLIDAFNEMGHQVYQRQKELEHQALSDSLTALPNRLMLHERLGYHLKLASRESKPLVLMMLDLNHFKEVNDTLGHHIGDQLLVQVGKRLTGVVREMDTVARLGGDEFAILLPGMEKQSAATVAEKIGTAINAPFIVHSYNLQISVSVGIAAFPDDAEELNTLMQHADVAMYAAKRGKAGYCHYDSRVDEYTVDRLSLNTDLQKAIKEDALDVYFQPKYALSTGELVGVEALLRWNHPGMGFISPEIIVDAAEKMGIIGKLTAWVIDKTVYECARCHQDGIAFSVSINLSVQNLSNEGLHSEVLDILQRHQLSADFISFEITESGMMTNPEESIGLLSLLNRAGIRLSVDDFGTGFSSLSYLKQLPVKELKIDKSFVLDMVVDDSDKVIVRSIVQLAHNLGLEVVAEGVENLDTWNLLKEMGCDFAQGYYMCRPLPIEEFRNFIANNHGIGH
jgi:diguanylate cyclase (GGDEF)-like protein